MATLVQLATKARRRLGLEMGEHTITCSTASNAADILAINDVLLNCNSSAAFNVADFDDSTNSTTVATSIKDLINALFAAETNIIATSASNVITINGARTVRVVNENTATQYLVSSTNTTDEPPYFSDMLEWVKEAELDITNKVVDDVFLADGEDGVFIEAAVSTSAGVALVYALPTDFLRAVELQYKTDVSYDVIGRAEKIPFDLLQDIRNGKHAFHTTYAALPVIQRWYSIYGGNIELGQTSAPHATTAMKLLYIKKPQTTVSSASTLPEFLQKTTVTYVCSQALYQLGKDAEAAAMMQLYEQGIMAANARYLPISEITFEKPH